MKLNRLALAVLFLRPYALAQAPLDAANVDRMVATSMAAKHIPALQMAIVKDDRIVYSKAFGKIDLESRTETTVESLFRTGSLAKPITAVAALTLADAGKLDLDAPVQKYCPPFPLKQWPITSRELLSHTSGIRHYRDDEIDNTRHYKFMSDGFAVFANDPLLFEPGTQYLYSTYGYTVVGCVIEGASGQSYLIYLQQHVLPPAGMTHTTVDDVFDILPHRARGYQYKDGEIKNAALEDSSYKIPGAGLDTTAEDLVHLAATLMSGGVLKPDTIATMWTPLTLRSGIAAGSGVEPNATYALGWEITMSKGRKIVWHTGNLQGFSNVLAILPDERFAVAILTNMEHGDPVDIANKLLESFAGVTTTAPKKQESP
jgi:CubicO group peptidase (beta-lactamase class C family)